MKGTYRVMHVQMALPPNPDPYQAEGEGNSVEWQLVRHSASIDRLALRSWGTDALWFDRTRR
jgi:hypothetical protein